MLNDDLVMASTHSQWMGGCSPNDMCVSAHGDDSFL